MKNELISMVDFVLAQNHRGNGNYTVGDEVISFHSVLKYATFLNTPLNLGMFVPAIEVDGKWEVLEEPESLKGFYETDKEGMIQERKDVEQYQQAKDKVIFEGFELEKVDDSGFYKLESQEMIIEVYMPIDSETEFLDILDNGLCKVKDLIKYKPTLTKKGVEISGLNR